jgi:hypothetical protein
MNLELNDKVVVVTGAAAGSGGPSRSAWRTRARAWWR